MLSSQKLFHWIFNKLFFRQAQNNFTEIKKIKLEKVALSKLAVHYHLRLPIPPVLRDCSHEAHSAPTNFQQNQAMWGEVIDDSTIFRRPF